MLSPKQGFPNKLTLILHSSCEVEDLAEKGRTPKHFMFLCDFTVDPGSSDIHDREIRKWKELNTTVRILPKNVVLEVLPCYATCRMPEDE